MAEVIKTTEFQSKIVDCRKRLDYLFDIYREIISVFEKENWDAKGPRMAVMNYKSAGIFSKEEIKRINQIGEDWENVALEFKAPPGKPVSVKSDFGELQERLEKEMFNQAFNCTLNSISLLSLPPATAQYGHIPGED